MKKYKVWMHIEEIDKDAGEYQDLEEHTESIGPEFDTPEEAVCMKDQLIDIVCDDGSICYESLDVEDRCPKCGDQTFIGRGGAIQCISDKCDYWRSRE